jgi:RNA recognition motif-containing protein
MTEWVAVVTDEGDEPIEIPTESDGTMLLSSLTAQFPGVTGLKFRNPSTNTLRGVRILENVLNPPDANDGWGTTTYICTRPAGAMSVGGKGSKKGEAAMKRKSENDPDGMLSKNQRVDEDDDDMEDDPEDAATCDLIVLGLPWAAKDEDIRDYFEAYGELMMIQLKKKDNGTSKGFAFIRFKHVDVQNKVLLTRHMIKDRWCDVKVPESQELKSSKAAASCKIFVARLSESVTPEDLKEHFETFGTVTDIYIPKPFRAFAFVTFLESRVAQSLFGKDHVIKGTSVHIGSAQPKNNSGGGGARGRDSGRDSGGGDVGMSSRDRGRGEISTSTGRGSYEMDSRPYDSG